MIDGGHSLEVVSKLVSSAFSYIDVFGPCDGNKGAQLKHLKKAYRRIAIVLHPDLYTVPDQIALAQQAFARMVDFHQQAQRAIEKGTYGDPIALVEIHTKAATHRIIKPLAVGDLADVFLAESVVGGATFPTVIKIARETRDADLLHTEEQALRILNADDTDEQSRPFVSTLVDSFAYSEPGKPNRAANVIAIPEEGFMTLAQLKDEHFPDGLTPRHTAWIWRRALVALGHAHSNGVIHGAVVPSNILVHPEQHGVVLIDWCYASIAKRDLFPPIQAIVDQYREWYPSEVTAKLPPSAATDIAMAARSMVFLMGGNPLSGELPNSVPLQMQRHFKGCLVTSQIGRPDNAFELLNEFDALLETIGKPYHPRVFRPLTINDLVMG